MAFIDELEVSASTGRGGDGVVRFLHEKGKEFGGPSGGNGGRGGDIIFRAVRDLSRLQRYRGTKQFHAERGEDGKGKKMTGRDGEATTIEVPIGSVVTRVSTGQRFEMLEEGEEIVALNGGSGGRGNAEFKSSTNQYPTEATRGATGESDRFRIEVKLIADAGLIGLPNAGKTSLLNVLTNAGAKVGDYAFTTLDPNLGAFHGYVIADIPGLVEGASKGKGLGDTFLRHISRTRLLVHCISSELDDPLEAYDTVREELKSFDTALTEKDELVVLTKADTISSYELIQRLARFKSRKINAFHVTILDDSQVKAFADSLTQRLSASRGT